MFNLDCFRRSLLIGTTLRAMPSKSHAFSTNYHTCIAIPTWHRCAPPILFWHWPPFNLFPSSCITWIIFLDSHWWVPLRVQYSTIYMSFRQIIMYILQCPHDIHVLVHLFCFDLHTFLLRSRAATCPTSNCGRGTSLFRQELVFFTSGILLNTVYYINYQLVYTPLLDYNSFGLIIKILSVCRSKTPLCVAFVN